MTVEIKIATKGREATFQMENVNFDESRDAVALRVGRQIVDAIYNTLEG